MFNKVNTNSVLIDVRDKEEHLSSSKNIIDKTINIPLKKIEKNIKKLKLSKNTPISTFCQSGKRSKVAVKLLKDMGYTNVTDLGGVDDVEFILN